MRQDVTVFRQEGLFAAWPANFLCQSWGDEILVAFQVCAFQYHEKGHSFDRDQDWSIYLARSLDGGLTWTSEKTPFYDPAPSQHKRCPELLRPFTGRIDFTDPDLCLLYNMSGTHGDDFSWWQYSTDRGHTWDGPFTVPDVPGITAGLNMRTQYIVENKDEVLLFMTCQRSNNTEGRVFCARMKEGGRSIDFLGFVGEELPEEGFSIMPQARRRADGTLVCFNRIFDSRNQTHYYAIEEYVSRDGGVTWTMECKPVENHGGNPGALAVMQDGTWVLLYGWRVEPYGIRLKYSEDEGRSWSDEIHLRDDGGSKDLGYPRVTVRGDGAVVVCYYFNSAPDAVRTIEATIFDRDFLRGK